MPYHNDLSWYDTSSCKALTCHVCLPSSFSSNSSLKRRRSFSFSKVAFPFFVASVSFLNNATSRFNDATTCLSNSMLANASLFSGEGSWVDISTKSMLHDVFTLLIGGEGNTGCCRVIHIIIICGYIRGSYPKRWAGSSLLQWRQTGIIVVHILVQKWVYMYELLHQTWLLPRARVCVGSRHKINVDQQPKKCGVEGNQIKFENCSCCGNKTGSIPKVNPTTATQQAKKVER